MSQTEIYAVYILKNKSAQFLESSYIINLNQNKT